MAGKIRMCVTITRTVTASHEFVVDIDPMGDMSDEGLQKVYDKVLQEAGNHDFTGETIDEAEYECEGVRKLPTEECPI